MTGRSLESQLIHLGIFKLLLKTSYLFEHFKWKRLNADSIRPEKPQLGRSAVISWWVQIAVLGWTGLFWLHTCPICSVFLSSNVNVIFSSYWSWLETDVSVLCLLHTLLVYLLLLLFFYCCSYKFPFFLFLVFKNRCPCKALVSTALMDLGYRPFGESIERKQPCLFSSASMLQATAHSEHLNNT